MQKQNNAWNSNAKLDLDLREIFPSNIDACCCCLNSEIKAFALSIMQVFGGLEHSSTIGVLACLTWAEVNIQSRLCDNWFKQHIQFLSKESVTEWGFVWQTSVTVFLRVPHALVSTEARMAKTMISELVWNKCLEVLTHPIYITFVFAKYVLDTFMEMLNYLVTYTDLLLVSQIIQLFDNVFNTMILVKFFFTVNPILLSNRATRVLSPSPSIIPTGVPCWIISLIAWRPASLSIALADPLWFHTQRCSLAGTPGLFLLHHLHVPQVRCFTTVFKTLFSLLIMNVWPMGKNEFQFDIMTNLHTPS